MAIKIADDFATVSAMPDYVDPILTVIPIQFLAFELGAIPTSHGTSAKSATVE